MTMKDQILAQNLTILKKVFCIGMGYSTASVSEYIHYIIQGKNETGFFSHMYPRSTKTWQ